jgi:hypothetical protein
VTDDLTRPYADVRSLASFLLSGWLTGKKGNRWLSDVELRTALVRGRQELRTHILWHVGHWKIGDKLYILREIWPLQLAARSSSVTDRLCALAFADQTNFAKLAQAILPFLTTMKGGAFVFPGGSNKITRILTAHPDLVLEILQKVLPPNGVDWPHGASDVIETLRRTSQTVRSDPRMIELTRRRRAGYH